MAKSKTIYYCTACGYESSKWMGRCPECDSWNSFDTQRIAGKNDSVSAKFGAVAQSVPQLLSEVNESGAKRVSTKISELDRVLGGGLVSGSAVLIGGSPGIGKSTLVLQMCQNLSNDQNTVLYASGEESAPQIKTRANRLQLSGETLYLLCETDLSAILEHAQALNANILVIDSIQTLYASGAPGTSGSISQIRENTSLLTRYAKQTGISVIIIGHVTKQGSIAGPMLLEHLVDAVLYFENERQDAYRVLRAVKNRYGSANEIGVFEMRESGMCEVTNPSRLFMGDRAQGSAGCAVLCALEGARPVMIEVQALCSRTAFGTPRRAATGVDINRMSLLCAVLEKKIGLNLSDQDIYLNVAGGLRLIERCADLAIAAAIASSRHNRELASDVAGIGEIGLTGEIRAVSHVQKRIDECEKMGYKSIILPKSNMPSTLPHGLNLIPVETLIQALEAWM